MYKSLIKIYNSSGFGAYLNITNEMEKIAKLEGGTERKML